MWDDEGAARKILTDYSVWAVVGASPDPGRASYGVFRFLQRAGYRAIPVNPNVDEVCGVRAYNSLEDIPAHEGVEVVDVFRRPEHVAGVLDQTIAIGAKALWCQLGVVDAAAYRRAVDAGLDVVMDRCPVIDHPRMAAVRTRA